MESNSNCLTTPAYSASEAKRGPATGQSYDDGRQANMNSHHNGAYNNNNLPASNMSDGQKPTALHVRQLLYQPFYEFVDPDSSRSRDDYTQQASQELLAGGGGVKSCSVRSGKENTTQQPTVAHTPSSFCESNVKGSRLGLAFGHYHSQQV